MDFIVRGTVYRLDRDEDLIALMRAKTPTGAMAVVRRLPMVAQPAKTAA
jgi:hypothetical protein